jgi:hypothetical protein
VKLATEEPNQEHAGREPPLLKESHSSIGVEKEAQPVLTSWVRMASQERQQGQLWPPVWNTGSCHHAVDRQMPRRNGPIPCQAAILHSFRTSARTTQVLVLLQSPKEA